MADQIDIGIERMRRFLAEHPEAAAELTEATTADFDAIWDRLFCQANGLSPGSKIAAAMSWDRVIARANGHGAKLR